MTIDVDDFLTHYGVKGMRWGVIRSKTPSVSRRERLTAAYSTKMSDVDARIKADARLKTEKTLLIVGGTTLVAALAVVAGKKLHTEFAPPRIKSNTLLQNVNQHGTDLNLDKITYATFKKRDNAIYKNDFVKELLSRPRQTNDVFVTQLKPLKDLKIPSKAQARKMFVEWEKAKKITPKAGVSITTRMINANRSSQIMGNKSSSGSFIDYVSKKGFDGIQDVMDQRKFKYGAKVPLMLANGAQSLMVKGAQALDTTGLIN
jgi:hypothetical protein